MNPIRAARTAAGLSGAEVAASVGRGSDWLGLVEAGTLTLSAEDEHKVLTAIDRLQRFAETVRTAKATLTHDLRLPPLRRSRNYSPSPGGKQAARHAS
jgi:hypothetical protein